MKNRLAFLLAAGAIALPAAAGDLDYNIYGTVMVFADSVKATDATPLADAPTNALVASSAAKYTGVDVPTRTRITSGTSNLGFKGSYKFTDDLSVTWQYESAIDLDSKDTSSTNVLGGRNKGIGIASKTFGQVLVGSWDTPYKMGILMTGALRGLDPFDDSISGNPGFGTMATITDSGPSTSVATVPVTVTTPTGTAVVNNAVTINSKNNACFNRRQGNSIQYWSPEIAGFSARVMYSVNEQKAPLSSLASQISPTVLSASLTYKIGTLTLFGAFDQHKDYFGLAAIAGYTSPLGQGAPAGPAATDTTTITSSTDTAVELGAYYVIPSTGTRLVLLCEQLKYHDDDASRSATRVNEYKRSAFFASVQQTFGPHKVFVNFGQAAKGDATYVGGATASTDGLGAKQYSLNYAYALGKKADLFASYYVVKNDKAASYTCFPPVMNPTTGGPSAVQTGAQTQGLGIGVLYTF